jgi:hypothetical protein
MKGERGPSATLGMTGENEKRGIKGKVECEEKERERSLGFARDDRRKGKAGPSSSAGADSLGMTTRGLNVERAATERRAKRNVRRGKLPN